MNKYTNLKTVSELQEGDTYATVVNGITQMVTVTDIAPQYFDVANGNVVVHLRVKLGNNIILDTHSASATFLIEN